MIVVLDDTLEEQNFTERSIEWSVSKTNKSLGSIAKNKGYQVAVDESMQSLEARKGTAEFRTLGFVGMLSRAYSDHLPVAVAPHDFWFIANSELAAIVSKNPEDFRHIFTSNPEGKETLLVPASSYNTIDYSVLARILEKKIPNKEVSDLMIPGLTTIDSTVFNALCATLADTVQHYYSYMTFCCGIPKIKVRGTKGDYWRLGDNARRLAEIFEFSAVAVEYYDRIAGLFDRMADSLSEEDPSVFWRDIFSQRNVGSGGEKEIDGWIRDFFTKRPSKLDSYETAIAAVPFKNLETDNEYLGLTGAFAAVRDKDGFWHSDFRETRYQKVDEKEAKPTVTSTSFTWGEGGGRTQNFSDGSRIFIPNETPEVEARKKEPVASWSLDASGLVINAERKVKDSSERQEIQKMSAYVVPVFKSQGLSAQEARDDLSEAYVEAVVRLMREEGEGANNQELMKAGLIRGVSLVQDESGLFVLEKKKEEKK